MKKVVVAAALAMWGAMASSASELAPRNAVSLPPAVARSREVCTARERDRAAVLSALFFVTITTVLVASRIGLGNVAVTHTDNVRTTNVRRGEKTGRGCFRKSPV
jgi:hypothetical protein